MSTRSLTTFAQKFTNDETKKVVNEKIVTVYRQSDGYPTGCGLELAYFLKSGKMVNGIPGGGDGKTRYFNGMGCLAAQFVAEFKDGAGGLYLYPVNTKNCWEEYRYEVIWDETKMELTMRCYEVNKKSSLIFEGTADEFIAQYETAKSEA